MAILLGLLLLSEWLLVVFVLRLYDLEKDLAEYIKYAEEAASFSEPSVSVHYRAVATAISTIFNKHFPPRN